MGRAGIRQAETCIRKRNIMAQLPRYQGKEKLPAFSGVAPAPSPEYLTQDIKAMGQFGGVLADVGSEMMQRVTEMEASNEYLQFQRDASDQLAALRDDLANDTNPDGYMTKFNKTAQDIDSNLIGKIKYPAAQRAAKGWFAHRYASTQDEVQNMALATSRRKMLDNIELNMGRAMSNGSLKSVADVRSAIDLAQDQMPNAKDSLELKWLQFEQDFTKVLRTQNIDALSKYATDVYIAKRTDKKNPLSPKDALKEAQTAVEDTETIKRFGLTLGDVSKEQSTIQTMINLKAAEYEEQKKLRQEEQTEKIFDGVMSGELATPENIKAAGPDLDADTWTKWYKVASAEAEARAKGIVLVSDRDTEDRIYTLVNKIPLGQARTSDVLKEIREARANRLLNDEDYKAFRKQATEDQIAIVSKSKIDAVDYANGQIVIVKDMISALSGVISIDVLAGKDEAATKEMQREALAVMAGLDSQKPRMLEKLDTYKALLEAEFSKEGIEKMTVGELRAKSRGLLTSVQLLDDETRRAISESAQFFQKYDLSEYLPKKTAQVQTEPIDTYKPKEKVELDAVTMAAPKYDKNTREKPPVMGASIWMGVKDKKMPSGERVADLIWETYNLHKNEPDIIPNILEWIEANRDKFEDIDKKPVNKNVGLPDTRMMQF